MEVTQTYARPSAGVMAPDGMHLDVSAEQSRPRVHLEAMVKDSLAYSRAMLALYDVVSGDFRPQQKDHAAYQEWVQQRYLEELPGEMASRSAAIPTMMQRRQELSGRIAQMQQEARRLESIAGGTKFHFAKYKYFSWLLTHNREAWFVLDPVVSVHPDCVIFEVFSVDESSYGRVTVPTESLEIFGDAVYGTTNIDYSRALRDEISRVRSYRRAWLQIGAEGVSVTTSAGEALEKKIDLPPSWLRGFLQVQSASAFSAVELKLSAATVAEVLSVLHRQKENVSPRSLRFVLSPGQKPSIRIDPWDIVIQEQEHVFNGSFQGEIRIWGRRRLFSLESLLPYADAVEVRLLGQGMPSYWSVYQKHHRFDLGLSGWTKNDWAQSARFDLLSTTTAVSTQDIEKAAKILEQRLILSSEQLAAQAGLPRDAATAALQRLCAEGSAMYDPIVGGYRWRPLFAFPVKLESQEDKRLDAARKLITQNAVKWRGPGEGEKGGSRQAENTTRVRAFVRAEKQLEVTLDVDPDGRVQYADCTCSWHRREKLRKGPCAHILAASALASKEVALQAAERSRAAGAAQANRFQGKTFVFTGALSLFTRAGAEELVKQAGGSATGSVSKNTSYVVAGDKAGSKLAKARELGIHVLTEEQFKAMLEGRE